MTKKNVIWLCIGLLIALFLTVFLCVHFIGATKDAQDEVVSVTDMSNASIESAFNAMNVMDQQLQNEQAVNDELEQANAEIRNTTDGNAAHAAGSKWLCKNYQICPDPKH